MVLRRSWMDMKWPHDASWAHKPEGLCSVTPEAIENRALLRPHQLST